MEAMRKGDGMRGQFSERGSFGYFSVLKSTKSLQTLSKVLVAVKNEDQACKSDGRVCKGL